MSKLPLFALAGMLSVAAPAAEPVVSVDYGWKSGKTFCLEQFQHAYPERRIGCETLRAEFDQFVEELETRFRSTMACEDVGFVQVGEKPEGGFYRPSQETSQKLTGAHWQLYIEFKPGPETQYWLAIEFKSGQQVLKGRGSPQQIAQSVCTAIKGQGGTILR
jgi:hypothetical protein